MGFVLLNNSNAYGLVCSLAGRDKKKPPSGKGRWVGVDRARGIEYLDTISPARLAPLLAPFG